MGQTVDWHSLSLDYVEALYARYVDDPQSVSESWRQEFESWTNGSSEPVRLGPSFGAWGVFSPPSDAGNGGARGVSAGQPVATVPAGSENSLSGMSLFRDLPAEDAAHVIKIAKRLSFEPEAVLCRQGDPGTHLFVIEEGSVRVERNGSLVAVLGPGEVVGELALLDKRPRSADVIVQERMTALTIEAADFQALLQEHSSLAIWLLGQLAARMRDTQSQQERVDQLVRAYRERGHVLASLDPLGRPREDHPELTRDYYGLTEADMDRHFSICYSEESETRPLKDILEHLRQTYCGSVGVQYMHIDDLAVQGWLRHRLEDTGYRQPLTHDQQVHILTKLTKAEVFEQFLHRKFVGAKRFSLEGAESIIPLLDQAIEVAGEHDVVEVVIGMAHRGRLNVLANTLNKPASQIFREFQDVDAHLYEGGGDVKYHMGHSDERVTATGRKVHVSLCFNPSHLECIGPVVLGRTRAKQDRLESTGGAKVLPIIIHGDAAFAGQGVVQELLNLSELPGYRTWGAVHIIINNQIGFTTLPEESRSSQYATDVARMLQIPIFHVNGEDPEAVSSVIQLAMDFRHTFNKDVVIDMYAFRRYGHNEGDDPTFTQPRMYEAINKRQTVREAYVENLLKLGGVTQSEIDDIAADCKTSLETDLAATKAPNYTFQSESSLAGRWADYRGGQTSEVPEVDTAISKEHAGAMMERVTQIPAAFVAHSKIKKLYETRREMTEGKRPFNWGGAEILAFASLADQGVAVRLSGQDTGRGTFSHRHAILHDQETGAQFIPLKHISDNQGTFTVWNSPLSETGVLGFEYGYSLDTPDQLIIWEAQFGDFANVAQVIIDQFVSSSEDKWRRLSGLTMLLPHGFEGQGPEHSSARLERFLTLAAEDNMQVVNLTTPAQIFHALRRQVLRPWRKPLIVMSPKSLLRHPKAVSTLEDITQGSYQTVIGDDGAADPNTVRRVLLCSGKLYYELCAERDKRESTDIAIVRLEQYYPLPTDSLAKALAPYPADASLLWVQDEPENMGAWRFLHCRLGTDPVLGGRALQCISRPESASPATGSAASHKLEQANLIAAAFELD